MFLIVTAGSEMPRTQEPSHGAGHTRPVNSGKLFVCISWFNASFHSSWKIRSFHFGIIFPSGQPVNVKPKIVKKGWNFWDENYNYREHSTDRTVRHIPYNEPLVLSMFSEHSGNWRLRSNPFVVRLHSDRRRSHVCIWWNLWNIKIVYRFVRWKRRTTNLVLSKILSNFFLSDAKSWIASSMSLMFGSPWPLTPFCPLVMALVGFCLASSALASMSFNAFWYSYGNTLTNFTVSAGQVVKIFFATSDLQK